MPTEPLLIRKSTNDLGILVAGQFHAAGLSEEVESHFLFQKQNVVPALRRGFVLPNAIPLSAVPVEMTGYSIEETDYFQWLDHMQKFADKHFGPWVLREGFSHPTRLPWKNVLVIFDPGLTNREMVDKALKARNLGVFERMDVGTYEGAGALSTCRLQIIERSPTPTVATRGLPPKYAKHWFGGRVTRPLGLRAYGIGTSVLHSVEKQFLDPEAKTATFFPENVSGGCVAYGCYGPYGSEVYFGYDDSDYEADRYGFREAIEVPLKPLPSTP